MNIHLNKILTSIFDEGSQPKLVVSFGSQKISSDVDLLIVYDEEYLNNQLCLGKLDCIIIDSHSLHTYILNFDVLYLEVIDTGNYVMGDDTYWKQLKSMRNEIEFDEEKYVYLLEKSMTYKHAFQNFFESYKGTHNFSDLIGAYSNLSYAMSYIKIAISLLKTQKYLNVTDLIQEDIWFKRITQKKKMLIYQTDISFKDEILTLESFSNHLVKTYTL